jgi:predicted CopG family antitoxin
VTADQGKLVRRWARKDRISVSDLIRELITRELMRREGAIRIVVVHSEAYQ